MAALIALAVAGGLAGVVAEARAPGAVVAQRHVTAVLPETGIVQTAGLPETGIVQAAGADTPTPTASPVTDHAATLGIDVAYHSQQDPDWCDPADIEMWLQADRQALPGSDDRSIQQEFWNYETSNNDGFTVAQWNASPYAVALTLNHYGGRTDIGDAPQPTSRAAGIAISQSLAVHHEPAIAMVNHGTHYVLVTGATLGPSGAAAPPVSVTFVNPLAFGVGGNPPRTSDAVQTASWDDFTAMYTANTAHLGVWAGQWVLIAAGTRLVG